MADTVVHLDPEQFAEWDAHREKMLARWEASAPHVPYQIWVMCIKLPDPEERRQAMEMWGIPDGF